MKNEKLMSEFWQQKFEGISLWGLLLPHPWEVRVSSSIDFVLGRSWEMGSDKEEADDNLKKF